MGTATSPPRMAPHQASSASAEFSMSVATRSPGRTPSSASALASRLAVPATAAAVNLVPQTSRYSPSGSVSSRRSSSAGTVCCSPLIQTPAGTRVHPFRVADDFSQQAQVLPPPSG